MVTLSKRLVEEKSAEELQSDSEMDAFIEEVKVTKTYQDVEVQVNYEVQING